MCPLYVSTAVKRITDFSCGPHTRDALDAHAGLQPYKTSQILPFDVFVTHVGHMWDAQKAKAGAPRLSPGQDRRTIPNQEYLLLGAFLEILIFQPDLSELNLSDLLRIHFL